MATAVRVNARMISIHAPLTGSDVHILGLLAAVVTISIHAPLTGSDPIPVTEERWD